MGTSNTIQILNQMGTSTTIQILKHAASHVFISHMSHSSWYTIPENVELSEHLWKTIAKRAKTSNKQFSSMTLGATANMLKEENRLPLKLLQARDLKDLAQEIGITFNAQITKPALLEAVCLFFEQNTTSTTQVESSGPLLTKRPTNTLTEPQPKRPANLTEFRNQVARKHLILYSWLDKNAPDLFRIGYQYDLSIEDFLQQAAKEMAKAKAQTEELERTLTELLKDSPNIYSALIDELETNSTLRILCELKNADAIRNLYLRSRYKQSQSTESSTRTIKSVIDTSSRAMPAFANKFLKYFMGDTKFARAFINGNLVNKLSLDTEIETMLTARSDEEIAEILSDLNINSNLESGSTLLPAVLGKKYDNEPKEMQPAVSKYLSEKFSENFVQSYLEHQTPHALVVHRMTAKPTIVAARYPLIVELKLLNLSTTILPYLHGLEQLLTRVYDYAIGFPYLTRFCGLLLTNADCWVASCVNPQENDSWTLRIAKIHVNLVESLIENLFKQTYKSYMSFAGEWLHCVPKVVFNSEASLENYRVRLVKKSSRSSVFLINALSKDSDSALITNYESNEVAIKVHENDDLFREEIESLSVFAKFEEFYAEGYGWRGISFIR